MIMGITRFFVDYIFRSDDLSHALGLNTPTPYGLYAIKCQVCQSVTKVK